MKFDVIIIGGGLAGLACGIRLAQAGKYCALISEGQSALHFSSGSFDFLNFLPDGSAVQHPQESLDALATIAPLHPYSILGKEKTIQFALESEQLVQECTIGMVGSIAENHQRVTPFGKFVPTWLSAPDVPTKAFNAAIPWKNIAIVNIEGFVDFYPEILADTLASYGVATSCVQIELCSLVHLRVNPSEFRSMNIARAMDRPENFTLLVEDLKKKTQNADSVFLPACIGQLSSEPVEEMSRRLGKPVRLIPTLPPSLLGSRINNALASKFRQLGGVLMPGDTARGHTRKDGNITELYTTNHEDIPLIAAHYVLATGSFFNNGLRSEAHRIYEPIFGLDIEYSPDRSDWTRAEFFAPQPYASMGISVDKAMRGTVNGNKIHNLHAAGMVIGNYNPVQEGCGAGVALVTAMAAANAILHPTENIL